MEEHKRKKLIILCSRNNHAKTLAFALQHLQNTKNILKGVNISTVTADQYDPGDRANQMDEIHESKEKHIVIVGPWAITGIDCPSLDAVLWNFIPGSEISVAQGTGRGSRISKGKEYLTVFFNIDLGKSLNEIQNSLTSTIQKLYESQFPSHDVTLKNRVRKILGRGFLTRAEVDSDFVEPLVRASLNDIYDSVSSVNLTNQISRFSETSNKMRAYAYVAKKIELVEGYSNGDSSFILHECRKFQNNEFYIHEFANKYEISFEESFYFLQEPLKKIEIKRKKMISDFFMS